MNRSTFALNEIGCGRKSRTFIFEFKARRVAGYTIPQKHCRLSIFDGRLKITDLRLPASRQFGNQKSAMTLVAVEGIEPTSLDYQSSALASELHRDLVLSFRFQVSS
jgi:hypothetical protein